MPLTHIDPHGKISLQQALYIVAITAVAYAVVIYKKAMDKIKLDIDPNRDEKKSNIEDSQGEQKNSQNSRFITDEISTRVAAPLPQQMTCQ